MNAAAKKVETERFLLKEPVEDPQTKSAHTSEKEQEGSGC